MGGYLGKSVGGFTSVTEKRQTFNISATTTQLTGLSYTPTKEEVHVNGIRYVRDVDYTANDGLTITLTNPLLNGDTAIVKSFPSFDVADTVSASNGGTFAGNVQMSGNATVGGTLGVTGNTTVGGDVHINPSTQAPLVVENPASNSLGAYVKIRDGNSTAGQHTWIGRSTHDTYLYANNNDLGIKITGGSSNAGTVTTPNQPSFSVRSNAGNSGNTWTQDNVIKFQTVQHNTGSHYSTSTGRFTAPVNGFYVFHYAGFGYNGGQVAAGYTVGVALRRNGSNYVMFVYDYNNGASGYPSSTGSVGLYLTANDYAEIYTTSQGQYADASDMYTHWSGYLLH